MRARSAATSIGGRGRPSTAGCARLSNGTWATKGGGVRSWRDVIAAIGLACRPNRRVKRMKVLVLGCSGQVGRELLQAQWAEGTVLAGLTQPDFDLASPATVDAALSDMEPDIVINAAAYTAV